MRLLKVFGIVAHGREADVREAQLQALALDLLLYAAHGASRSQEPKEPSPDPLM